MNINKKILKGTALTACAATIIATTGVQVASAGSFRPNPIVSSVRAGEKQTSTSAADADGKAFKDETVYVIADASGNQQKVIVSDWLKNKNSSDTLADVSNLSDITNVKGYEKFDKLSGDAMNWEAKGNDIYYQGTSDQETPVSVKVTYKLDGVETAPADLVGKSGKLTVRYDFTNNQKQTVKVNGKDEEIYTPFLMVTGCVLPTDKYSNVEVTNGKLVSDGNKQMIVGVSLPGMKDSLKLEDNAIDIPEYFEYSADVTDYEVGTSVSVGLNDVFSDLKLDKDSDLDDIQSKIDKLTDGVDKLMDGSSDLYDGLDKLLDASGKLYNGGSDLYDATSTLSDGAGKLYDGAGKLADGTSALYDGAGKLADGTNTLYDGITTLNSKTGEFGKGVTTLSDGLSKMKDGLKSAQSGAKKLNDGASSLETGAKTLSGGLKSTKAGMDKIVSNYTAAEAGAKQLKDGGASLKAGADSLSAGIEKVNGTYGTLDATVSNDEQIVAALKQLNQKYNDASLEAVIGKLEKNTAGQKQIASGLSQAGKQLKAGADQVSAGAGQVSGGASSLADGVNALSDGSKQVQTALDSLYSGSKDLVTGTTTLKAGTSSLYDGSKKLYGASGELAAGGKKLADATSQITTGVDKLATGAGTLKDGVATLHTGAKDLNDGAGTLKENLGTLNDGASKLNEGAGTLKDKLGDLKEGVTTLKDGSGKLKDGIKKLNDEGISKITDTFGDDISSLVDRFNAIMDAGKAYKTYTSLGDDMDGSVKFVIKLADETATTADDTNK